MDDVDRSQFADPLLFRFGPALAVTAIRVAE